MKKNNNNKKNNDNSKPIRNYIILLLLFAIGIGLTLYLCKWYKVIDQEKKQTPVIRGTLTNELYANELDAYLVEYPSSVLYLCTSDSTRCRTFEKHFKKYIKQSSMSDYIVYVNLTNVNQEEFVKAFNDKYSTKKKLTTSYPALVVLNDGKISDIIQNKKEKKLTVQDAKDFLIENEIGD